MLSLLCYRTLSKCTEMNLRLTYHFTNGVLGLVQLLASSVNQALSVLDASLGLLCLRACVVHRVADVLQPVPLGCQSVVDVVETFQQAFIHICVRESEEHKI